MKKCLISILVFLSLCLNYGWAAVPMPLVWESSYTKTLPSIDGKVNEVWEKAKPLIVTLREAIGGDNPREVILRALHTEDTFYMMAQWHDDNRSDMRDPYVWNAEKKDYERPSKPDDQFALEFPLTGNFDIRMITLVHEYTADVWHWKAGRGNPVGWVDDKRHIISQKPIPGGVEYSMGGHGKVYIARILDEGIPSYHLKPKPVAFEGEIVDSFESVQPTNSLADVHGKGIYDGKTWTLEMSRKFNTGHDDDAVIDSTKDNICAIAVLDDELYWEHSVSSVITLRFFSKKN
ncbi:MAG TPA: ethylbenzene dehydrogenase-related protein [Candidatus Brocadiia bacterium]|nr:ethylbenzene dehydrogenase-related protein [Candidatus Brocadiales bacterium]